MEDITQHPHQSKPSSVAEESLKTGIDSIKVRSIQQEKNVIYFESEAPTPAEQLQVLRSPEAEAVYVAAARKELNLTSPGISNQTSYNVNNLSNQVVNPRMAQNPQQPDGEVKTVWAVEFNSLFD